MGEFKDESISLEGDPDADVCEGKDRATERIDGH